MAAQLGALHIICILIMRMTYCVSVISDSYDYIKHSNACVMSSAVAASKYTDLRTLIECASIHANNYQFDRTYGFVYDSKGICEIYSIDEFITCDVPDAYVYTKPTVTGIQAINLVSQGRPVTMISERPSYPKTNVVDGDLRSMAHSVDGVDNPWFKVDLQDRYIVDRVKYYNRKDCCGERTKNLHITVADTDSSELDDVTSRLCWKFNGAMVNGQIQDQTCATRLRGRYVQGKLYASAILINFLELQVLAY